MPQNYDTCSPNNTPPTQYVNSTNLGTPVLNYDISFPYIAANDIVVFTGDTGNWTLRNQGTAANEYAVTPQTGTGTDEVVFVGGTPGANILITRRTDICAAARVFQAGSSIRAEDLNTDMNQLRFLYQELYSFLEMFVGNEGDELVPGENPSLGDLGDVEITTPANPSWLRWNGTQWEDRPILQDGDAWVADDNHVVTSEAGDDRWLTIPGGGGTAITAGDGIRLDAPAEINVDLAATSGLEFTTGDLRIDANDGCEIVAAGLNAETTDASIVQTGGTDANPAIRVATTLGTTTTNNDLQISGGANVTVTRNNDNQLTIAAAAATGGATFRGTVDVDNNNTLPGTTGQQNPNAVAVGDGFTVENNVAAADVTANWNTVLDNWDTADGIINSGDVILCITAAAAGSPTDARYNLVRTGGNINTLQQVTEAGNTTDEGIITRRADATNAGVRVEDASNNPAILLFGNGVATFNEQGLASDFRVESDGNQNMLFVDGTNNRVGIGTATPGALLDVNGNAQVTGDVFVRTGNNVQFNNAANDQSISINADDATATYNLTLPPTRPTAANRVLAAAGTGTGADQELEWVAGGAAALWEVNGDFLRPAANDEGVQIRDSDAADVSTELTREGGATFNQQQNDVDFRISGDTFVDLFFVDGGNNRVGLGTNAPDTVLDVAGTVSIAQNAITAGAGNWNLANGNFWTLGAVVIPNPTNIVAGVSGLIVNTAAATWPAAGGAVFQYANNTPPNITEFPAVIPFYCTNNTTIFIGTPTVNIT